jgi:hypothetical protein
MAPGSPHRTASLALALLVLVLLIEAPRAGAAMDWTRYTYLARDYYVAGTHPESGDAGIVRMTFALSTSYEGGLCNGTLASAACMQVRRQGHGVIRVAEETALASSDGVAVSVLDGGDHVLFSYPAVSEQGGGNATAGAALAAAPHLPGAPAAPAATPAAAPAAALTIACAAGVRTEPQMVFGGYSAEGTLLLSLAHECGCAATTFATCNTTYTPPEQPLPPQAPLQLSAPPPRWWLTHPYHLQHERVNTPWHVERDMSVLIASTCTRWLSLSATNCSSPVVHPKPKQHVEPQAASPAGAAGHMSM